MRDNRSTSSNAASLAVVISAMPSSIASTQACPLELRAQRSTLPPCGRIRVAGVPSATRGGWGLVTYQW
jgi:hypothetical protein